MYYVDVSWEDSKTLSGTMADVALVSRLFDDADAPVPKAEMVDAVTARPRSDSVSADFRARYAIDFLRKSGLIRAVMDGDASLGWVWNDRDIDNDEWRRRAQMPPVPHLFGGVRASGPIGVIRISPPQAYVVTIGHSDE